MTRLSSIVVVAFALGFTAALMTIPGCSEAATRKLTIFQFQSTKTYDGPFRIDTSEVPSDAIKSQTETGKPGKPETQLTLNQDYQIEVVLRLVNVQKEIKQ